MQEIYEQRMNKATMQRNDQTERKKERKRNVRTKRTFQQKIESKNCFLFSRSGMDITNTPSR